MEWFGIVPLFLKFWFIEAPKSIWKYFASLNAAFLELFSLPLLVRTYFRPWKNEYRKGLVGFAIGMGITIKSFVILVDMLLFGVLLGVELLCLLLFVAWPFITLAVLIV